MAIWWFWALSSRFSDGSLTLHQEDSHDLALEEACKGLAAGLSVCFVNDAHALPAFARKYGLRCSACHEAWPMLNYFGQKFKDNGYQLMNDRDSPIWQNPS